MGVMAVLSGCQEEQREITANHSSAMVFSQKATERSDQGREATRQLGYSVGWDKAIAVAVERTEESVEIAAVEEVVIPEPENTPPLSEEEPVWEEPAAAIEMPVEPVEEPPVVEESLVPAEPVYEYKTTYEEIVLSAPLEYVGNPDRDNDAMPLTLQEGAAGKEVHTWLHTYQDGTLIDSHITKTSRVEPIPTIVDVPTNIVVVPEHSSYEEELAKMKAQYPGAFE